MTIDKDLDLLMGSGQQRFADPIKMVTEIRKRNNDCWMDLLRLAMKHAPEETRLIMADITKNDEEVTGWLKQL